MKKSLLKPLAAILLTTLVLGAVVLFSWRHVAAAEHVQEVLDQRRGVVGTATYTEAPAAMKRHLHGTFTPQGGAPQDSLLLRGGPIGKSFEALRGEDGVVYPQDYPAGVKTFFAKFWAWFATALLGLMWFVLTLGFLFPVRKAPSLRNHHLHRPSRGLPPREGKAPSAPEGSVAPQAPEGA